MEEMRQPSQVKPAGCCLDDLLAHDFIVEWLKLTGLSDAKACRGGHLPAPSSSYASSQYALLALLDRAEEVGLRLLDGTEKVWLRFLVEGGVAGLATHDGAEKVWLRHCGI